MGGNTKSAKRDLLPFQIVMGVTSAAIGGIVTVMGELRDELELSSTGIGMIVTAGFLAAFVAQLSMAHYADRGYAREMVVIGIAISAVALLVMVVADGLLAWCLARSALGFAGGLIMPGLRRAASVLDPERVGENLGRLIVGEVGGFLCGPILAGVLAEIGGIRLPFAVFAGGMVLFIPFAIRLPADRGALDTSGRRTSFDLLRVRRLQGALLLVWGYFMLIGAFESVLPLMFRDRGASTLLTGIAFTSLGLPIILVSTRAGRLADKVGAARVATWGITVVALVSATYGVLPGLMIPIAVMFVVGVADGFGFTAAQVAVSRAVHENRQAGALGLMGATEVLGAGLAALPAAMLYDSVGARWTWLALGTATLASVAIAQLRFRGTEPVNRSGLDLDLTPLDRHPTPQTIDRSS